VKCRIKIWRKHKGEVVLKTKRNEGQHGCANGNEAVKENKDSHLYCFSLPSSSLFFLVVVRRALV
jgi:hypothetical protein